jgi:glyoxylase I family protein
MAELTCTGIDHLGLAADDVDKLADWYCDVLGYKKVFRHDKPVWMIMAPDNTLIEIMPKDNTPRPERTTWTPGWSHLVIRVDDFDIACEFLEEKGIEFASDEIAAIGGGRVKNFYDIEGNMLQVLWRDPKIFNGE